MSTSKIRSIGAAAVLAVSVGACQNSNMGTKEGVGTLLGAAAGGYAGSHIGSGSGRLAATAAGTLLGGLLGNQIGASLDRADQAALNQSAQRAFETSPDGQQVAWRNPNSGNYGYTQPTRTYQTNSGQYCRQYQTTVVIDGRAQSGTGTACRQSDGSWRIVS